MMHVVDLPPPQYPYLYSIHMCFSPFNWPHPHFNIFRYARLSSYLQTWTSGGVTALLLLGGYAHMIYNGVNSLMRLQLPIILLPSTSTSATHINDCSSAIEWQATSAWMIMWKQTWCFITMGANSYSVTLDVKHICACVCVLSLLCTCMYVCMNVCMNLCMNVWMYVCMYACVYA